MTGCPERTGRRTAAPVIDDLVVDAPHAPNNEPSVARPWMGKSYGSQSGGPLCRTLLTRCAIDSVPRTPRRPALRSYTYRRPAASHPAASHLPTYSWHGIHAPFPRPVLFFCIHPPRRSRLPRPPPPPPASCMPRAASSAAASWTLRVYPPPPHPHRRLTCHPSQPSRSPQPTPTRRPCPGTRPPCFLNVRRPHPCDLSHRLRD